MTDRRAASPATSAGAAEEGAPAVPARVVRAVETAARAGFGLSAREETGRLLRALAAARPGGRVAESGTGVGVGAAWLLDGMDAAATLVTVERDERRAALAAEVLGDDPRVRPLVGDWTLLHDHAPYDVFFCDGGGKRDDPHAVVGLLAPGGVLVLDDWVPATGWPPLYDGEPDTLRIRYLTDPRLVTTEVMVAPDLAVVLGVRRS